MNILILGVIDESLEQKINLQVLIYLSKTMLMQLLNFSKLNIKVSRILYFFLQKLLKIRVFIPNTSKTLAKQILLTMSY